MWKRPHCHSIIVAVLAIAALGVTTSRADTTDTTLGQGIGTAIPDVFGDGSGVAIATSVAAVTYGDPIHVHRGGLNYWEVTGTIRGIGWGGEWEDPGPPPTPFDALVHYAYDVPFVLRWPASWDRTLIYYSHGRTSLGLLTLAESGLGAANEGRHLEHEGDFVADAVLAPLRGHAYFAANLNGLKGDGSFSILGLEPPFLDEPLKATLDVPLARDLVQVATRLLAKLTGRSTTRVIGTGHSAGALVMQYLDGGLTDSPNSGIVTFSGGDFTVPYDASSGTLFHAFVPLAGGNFRLHPAFPMAAPMLMIGGLAEFSAFDSVLYARRLLVAGVDINASFRTYQVRNLPHSWAEIVESTPNLNAFLGGVLGLTIHADGDRMQPVVAAVIDAAVALLKSGAPPPVSRIDGVGLDTDATPGPDAIGFAQADGTLTSLLPSVFDPSLDVYDGFQFEVSVAGGFPNSVPRYLQVRAAHPNEPALSLPKVTCRLGGFRISEILSDSELLPFDFAAHWKNEGAYRACVTHAVNELRAQRLYGSVP
jgi:hypothetical protein